MASARKPGGRTLRQRIMAMFLSCMLAVLICYGFLIATSYRKLVVQRVDASYSANVKQFNLSFSNLISALNHVSQQLACNDLVSLQLETLLTADHSYQRIEAYDTLKSMANFAVFSNPSIGLYAYGDAETGFVYHSNGMLKNPALFLDESQLLFRYADAAYYTCFPSYSEYSNRPAIAITRCMEINGVEVVLFVESNFRALDDIIHTYQLPSSTYLLLDNDGKIVFSLKPECFPKGMTLDIAGAGGGYLTNGDHMLFPVRANQGWYSVLAVENEAYHHELITLIIGFVLTSVLLLALLGMLFWALWWQIDRPLVRFDKVIDAMLADDEATAQDLLPTTAPTGLGEYDRLICKILDMRQQLQEMVSTVSMHEKLHAQMMIRRLRSQINPHFLMNTLNTVHWMATLKNETEIDDMIVALNRLLSYNLQRGNDMATLGDEINAVEQYIKLQMKRYDITYQCRITPQQGCRQLPFPKFILQPLVENSLYHGYRTGMQITLSIEVKDRICITVRDDGVGMTKEKMQVLESHLAGYSHDEDPPGQGMGIGMRYVVSILRMIYQDDLRFSVNSELDRFTVVTLSVPKEVKDCNGCFDC